MPLPTVPWINHSIWAQVTHTHKTYSNLLLQKENILANGNRKRGCVSSQSPWICRLKEFLSSLHLFCQLLSVWYPFLIWRDAIHLVENVTTHRLSHILMLVNHGERTFLFSSNCKSPGRALLGPQLTSIPVTVLQRPVIVSPNRTTQSWEGGCQSAQGSGREG